MPNAFQHGKIVALQVGGTYFAALGVAWNDALSDLEDITFTVQGGATFAVKLPGYRMGKGTIEAVYDADNVPFTGAINMTPGTLMALIFTYDGTDLFTVSAWARENDYPGAGPTKGPVKFTVPFETTGSYTVP